MDGTRFDVWTRRRIGWAAGGVAVSLLSPPGLESVDAKKKKKKVRCRTLLQTCGPDVKEERCCSGLNCDPVSGLEGLRCCLGHQHRCQDNSQCCGDILCEADNDQVNRCCGNGGAFCTEDADCCFGAPCSDNACEFLSDRNLKANFASIDPADMLNRVRGLPISTWSYFSDDSSIRHIGPMAQDFAAAFRVETDDRHIYPIDGQGVALAAIQGLYAELERLRAENSVLATRLDILALARSNRGADRTGVC